nr:MAG TPA: hypothetical protein [Caudoviricetes sp.]
MQYFKPTCFCKSIITPISEFVKRCSLCLLMFSKVFVKPTTQTLQPYVKNSELAHQSQLLGEKVRRLIQNM